MSNSMVSQALLDENESRNESLSALLTAVVSRFNNTDRGAKRAKCPNARTALALTRSCPLAALHHTHKKEFIR